MAGFGYAAAANGRKLRIRTYQKGGKWGVTWWPTEHQTVDGKPPLYVLMDGDAAQEQVLDEPDTFDSEDAAFAYGKEKLERMYPDAASADWARVPLAGNLAPDGTHFEPRG